MSNLPSGTITFLFTDIEGSTKLPSTEVSTPERKIYSYLSAITGIMVAARKAG